MRWMVPRTKDIKEVPAKMKDKGAGTLRNARLRRDQDGILIISINI